MKLSRLSFATPFCGPPRRIIDETDSCRAVYHLFLRRLRSAGFQNDRFLHRSKRSGAHQFRKRGEPVVLYEAAENTFSYTSTTNWAGLNDDILRQYQVVLFLDTRPETHAQREAFKNYMEHGGAWM